MTEEKIEQKVEETSKLENRKKYKRELNSLNSVTSSPNYARGTLKSPIVRVHPETGQRIPRVRMSKKERLRLRKELTTTLEVK